MAGEDLSGGVSRLKPIGTPNKALTGATIGFFIGFGAVSLFGPTASNFIEVVKSQHSLAVI